MQSAIGQSSFDTSMLGGSAISPNDKSPAISSPISPKFNKKLGTGKAYAN